MKEKIQAYILRVLGVDAALANQNRQMEQYVENSIDSLRTEVRHVAYIEK